MSNLVDLLERRTRETPDRTYLIYQNEAFSYGRVGNEAARYRTFLEARGVRHRRHVVLLMNNGPRFFAAFFGVQRAGAIPVPLSPKSPPERIDYVIADCDAVAVVVDDDLLTSRPGGVVLSPAAQRLAVTTAEIEAQNFIAHRPATPHPAAFVQYTSGSTGEAKGAVISHRAVLANIAGFAQALAIDPERDVMSSMMPLFHDMGLVCFGLGSLYTGVPLVLYRQEAISLYHWLEGFALHRVTVTGGPNIFLQLANRVVRDPGKYDLTSLRAFICGSEPISPSVVSEFEERYRVQGKVKPAYGMAEVTLCATITAAGDQYRVHEGRIISCGKPLGRVRVAILTGEDVVTRKPYVSGEVLVETPSLMDGYLHRPELTQRALYGGCYRSGDVGFLDEEGRLYISGRKKNLIIRGGEKLAPSDLESIAFLEPEIALCAVVGVDDGAGAMPSVVLVAEIDKGVRSRPDGLRALARRVCAAARRRIGYAPDRLVFAAKGRIPTTLNGKVQHAVLKELLEKGQFPLDGALHAAELGG
jgi:acyl-CoA synthetase (AMP-forming)/AMP-acid ligase II